MTLALKSLWKGVAIAIPFCILFAPKSDAQALEIEILWENSMAVGISFQLDQDRDLLTKTDHEQIISVNLPGAETSILGKIEKIQNSYSFFPVIPFTFGLSYQIKSNKEVLHEFTVPFPNDIERSSVTNIFPSAEEIPANLLKIHVHFSQPMEEGRSMDYIHVITESGDTIQNLFLNLQPELWNKDQTGLTMWLDPGRIKRDLQPNLKMGPPLKINSTYQIVVSKSWKDKVGMEVLDDFSRTYMVIDEDRERPDVETWDISYPVVKTRNTINIDFSGAIDYELAMDAIYIYKDDKIINGNVALSNNESKWRFEPVESWLPGNYEIIIESRLEDLAGNNLNRLFDRDLENENNDSQENNQVEISFKLTQIAMQ